jgi:SAM-dependent methyltransferase
VPIGGSGVIPCTGCGFQYQYAPKYLMYDSDILLFREFKNKYLLNRVLNNNAYLSYQFLREASLSLGDRQDVRNFKAYILSHVTSGKLLDVGCGVLEVPGYLDFEDKSKFEFFGIDPIDDRSFRGMRVVGCGEFMPFQDEEFDVITFATSLDHVCSLQYTIRESSRILKKGGKVIVWMSDRSESPMDKAIRWTRWLLREVSQLFVSDRFVFDSTYPLNFGRFVVYPNHTVLYVPKGAVDPFHTYLENPREIIATMKRFRLRHIDTVSHNRDETFLCFIKN